MKATSTITETITLEMTRDQAEWLKGVMQNPLDGNHPMAEDPYDSNQRLALWSAINNLPRI